jgi:D-glycero-D-manno-heptose 1,7-bisphosphate phosphatase
MVVRNAVFLDRDGIINHAIVRDGRPFAPLTLEGFTLYEEVGAALEIVNTLDFVPIVVTNQPDVATGKISQKLVEAMHDKILHAYPIKAVKVCFHLDHHGCRCRKPQAGMLFEAAADYHLNLAGSYMIGDRWRDIAAGHAAGCHTIFVDRGYQEKSPEHPHVVVKSLLEAAHYIAERSAYP